MAIFLHDEHGLVEVDDNATANRGWIECKDEGGETYKVRVSHLRELELSDDDGEETKTGDVFPAGIRETYERGKTAEGAAYIDNGDELARQLRGAELDQVARMAAEICGEKTAQGWIDHYTVDREAEGKARLNPGMVRMNLGNRIRAALKRKAEEESKAA